MFLEFMIVLIFIFIVLATLTLSYTIAREAKTSRKSTEDRDEQIAQLLKQVDDALIETLTAVQHLRDYQMKLGKKQIDLSQLMNDHHAYVEAQYDKLTVLAKADILSARREELLRTKELKIALERLMGVALTSRQPAAPNDVLAIENLTSRIQDLETLLTMMWGENALG